MKLYTQTKIGFVLSLIILLFYLFVSILKFSISMLKGGIFYFNVGVFIGSMVQGTIVALLVYIICYYVQRGVKN